MQTINDIRARFLEFFDGNDHVVIPSASLVPHNDPTLMFVNAGMVPFKNIFSGSETLTGKDKNPVKRAASSQKCVRAGGKHNDLDNVGYTARHHTFFEMLGNFSFADYFKEEAIKYAWDFLTKTMSLPADKLLVTIYHTDDEAFDIWKKVSGFTDDKIIRIATNDNFWAMGDTGPCGPCSEIFYDHGEDIAGGPPGSDDEDGDRFVEIWNLVFMQYEKLAGGEQADLPKPCIDTGMGLERMATIMQGVHDNYDTDLFRNLIAASIDISGNNNPDMVVSHRVIADHLRSCSFLLADGVMPSNEGRGYVLRRIMRRAMRHVHILGCGEPLMHKLVSSLISEMGRAYPELGQAESAIKETLKLEEERFKETLERGLRLLEEESSGLSAGDILGGDIAFKLYDTYGFPLDLTGDILRSRDITVDYDGFNAAMDEQRQRARAAWAGSGDAATDEIWFEIRDKHGATEFLGYDTVEASGKVIAIICNGAVVDNAKSGDEISIITNQTPFYAESGGQAGDKGEICIGDTVIEITDTVKQLGALHVHVGKVSNGEVKTGDIAEMKVDNIRRDRLRSNHSATHILHAALRKTLGSHVTQKGSLVEADYFRFDFSNPKAVGKAELQQIEDAVNDIIEQNSLVTTRLMTPDEAIAAGAMALFGEKYGDEVRVVNMGEDTDSSYSVELCGGTHVSCTGDIGTFRITRESSVASGIRRIEAVTGDMVGKYIKQQEQALAEAEKRKQESASREAGRAEAIGNIREELADDIKNAEKIGDILFLGKTLKDFPPKDLRGLVDDFRKQVECGIIVIISDNEGKASIVVGVTGNITDRVNAVDLVRKGSEILGGKGGGGRPDFAQAGGTSPESADKAIEEIKKSLDSRF